MKAANAQTSNAYPIPAATTTPPQMAKIVAPINPVLTNPVRVAISRAKVLINPDATTMIIQPTLQPTTQREVLLPRVQIRTTTNPVSKTWADTNSAVHISSVPTTATSAATTAISSVPARVDISSVKVPRADISNDQTTVISSVKVDTSSARVARADISSVQTTVISSVRVAISSARAKAVTSSVKADISSARAATSSVPTDRCRARAACSPDVARASLLAPNALNTKCLCPIPTNRFVSTSS